MKKLCTILFIAILCIAQYTKQLSYIGCKLFNSNKTNLVKCDCEKILNTESNHDNSPNTVHKHLQIEDYIVI